MEFSARIHELSEVIQRRRGLSVARFRKRKDLKVLIPKLKDLYNGAIQGTTDGTPITDSEAKSLGSQILLKESLGYEEIPIFEIPPAIIVHAGPKVLGLVFFVTP